jgi:hypothetical protein
MVPYDVAEREDSALVKHEKYVAPDIPYPLAPGTSEYVPPAGTPNWESLLKENSAKFTHVLLAGKSACVAVFPPAPTGPRNLQVEMSKLVVDAAAVDPLALLEDSIQVSDRTSGVYSMTYPPPPSLDLNEL